MTMDKITIKTPNPKGRLFLKNHMHIELFFGGESKIKHILRSQGRRSLNIISIYFFEHWVTKDFVDFSELSQHR
jgi:hypothetical protein